MKKWLGGAILLLGLVSCVQPRDSAPSFDERDRVFITRASVLAKTLADLGTDAESIDYDEGTRAWGRDLREGSEALQQQAEAMLKSDLGPASRRVPPPARIDTVSAGRSSVRTTAVALDKLDAMASIMQQHLARPRSQTNPQVDAMVLDYLPRLRKALLDGMELERRAHNAREARPTERKA